MGDHLTVVRKHRKFITGQKPLGPELPAELAYIWLIYSELDDARDPGFSYAPLNETDLYHYALNRGFRWKPCELRAVRALDRAHRHFIAQNKNGGEDA